MNNVGKYINAKEVAIGLIIGLSIIVWCVILWLTKTSLVLNWSAFKHLPTVITVDVFLYGLFVNWIWKWKRLQGWLVPFPDLNGTWTGKIKSLWKNPETGESIPELDATLTINQTFLSVHCAIKTAESESKSYSASFLINPDTGIKQLVYNYYNKPKPSVRDRSIPHDGTVLLNINGDRGSIKLEGEYWTSRRSNGEIRLERSLIV